MDIDHLEVYKVGGVVRDRLLNLTPHEVDWVVIGATVEQMLKLGFKQVGRDFPVFLHPDTNEEYALARKERKIASGHQGFECFSDPTIKLEDDLKRRDLTINAIAQAADGTLIDPFNGQEDLLKKQFRHVSPAFVEDPLRVLRVARFAARFPDFQICPETMILMQKMVADGLLTELTPERVWKEVSRALTEVSPTAFFQILEQCQASSVLWPLLPLNLKGLTRFAINSQDVVGRFSVLFWGVELTEVKTFSRKWRIPNTFAMMAEMIAKTSRGLQVAQTTPLQLVQFFELLDVRRKRPHLKLWLTIIAEYTSITTAAWFEQALEYYFGIDEAAISQACQSPQAIKGAIHTHRIQAVTALFKK